METVRTFKITVREAANGTCAAAMFEVFPAFQNLLASAFGDSPLDAASNAAIKANNAEYARTHPAT